MRINNLRFVPRDFVVCKFYEIETCFCLSDSQLIVFPYEETNDGSARDVRVLPTPAPVRSVLCFNGRIFVTCKPSGAYKLSRGGAFALLSKNALAIGTEYCHVLIDKGDGVYLDDKQTKLSKLLFSYPVPASASEQLCAFTLIHEDTEAQLLEHFTSNQLPQTRRNLCVIGYGRKLFVLADTDVRLVHTSDSSISHITPVKRENKVAGLLLFMNLDTVILLHSGKHEHLAFEKVNLGRSIRGASALCAFFSSRLENVLWIVYCDPSKLYYVRKELGSNLIKEEKVEERTFACLKHYRSNIILGLSDNNELVKICLNLLDNSLSMNNNIDLHPNMFQKTNYIMDEIYVKVKQLDVLYQRLADERDKLKRLNLYTCERKLLVSPYIEVSRLHNYYFLVLRIPEKLPKNCYVIFSVSSKNQNLFCIKETTETEFTIKMPININDISHSASISMQLVTLMNEEAPWYIIRNFIKCPQREVKKRKKKDKTAFIDAKITLLKNLIKEGELNMTKLREIKTTIRAEL